MYADIVFPQKVGPLTYALPEGHPEGLEGRLVEAPLRMNTRFGLLLSASGSAVPADIPLRDRKVVIKPLSAIHEVLFRKCQIELLGWLSSYYLASVGTALNSMYFEEMVIAAHPPDTPKKRRGRKKTPATTEPTATSFSVPDVRDADLQVSLVSRGVEDCTYAAYLLHAPSRLYEYGFLLDVISRAAPSHAGILVLVPEIGRADYLAHLLSSRWGPRVCVLHSRLTKGQRTDAVRSIITGRSDIVIGTRSAVLAPVRRASLIVVTEEHHPSYKGEEGLRYHARDVAVMRAFIEKSTVLLSSVSPSLETFHNTMKGKYLLVTERNFCSLSDARSSEQPRDDSPHTHAHRPDVRVVDVRRQDPGSAPLPAAVITELRKIIGAHERVLILASRKGYSLLRCADCGHLFICPRCGASLVFSRERSALRCGRCTFEGGVPVSCESCGGFSIEGVGTGTERLHESLKGLFGVEPVLIEKRPLRMRIKELTPRTAENALFIIGTAYAERQITDMSLGAAVLMNVDSLVSQPHFRAYEHAFQEVREIIQLIKPRGTLYLATRMPGNTVFRHLKRHTVLDFLREEHAERAKFRYPPFSRMILLSIETLTERDRIVEIMEDAASQVRSGMLDVFGPVSVSLPRREDRRALQLVLKSSDRRMLHDGAKKLMSRLQVLKGVSVTADVDPLKI